MAFPVHFLTKVESIERHSDAVHTFTFAPSGRIPRFKPGQFVHLTLDTFDPSSHWPESRVFSIASAPSQKFVRLTIGRQGAYTNRILDTLQVGQEISLKGPYGEFVVAPQEPSEHLVLVAGGTGITPFCSYLEELSLKPESATNPVHLFYAVRQREHFIYRNLVESCRKLLPQLHVHYFCENGAQGDDVAARLSIADILQRLPNRQESRFYLSGPQTMIQTFSHDLTSKNSIAPSRVVIDAWE